MLKISTRISLLYLTASAIIIGMMGISMYYIYYAQRLQSIDAELQDYAEFLTTNQYLESRDLSYVFKRLTSRRDVRKKPVQMNFNFILANKDSVIFESDEKIEIDSLINPIFEADEKTMDEKYRFIKIQDEEYRLYKKRIKGSKNDNLELLMITSLDRFTNSLNTLSYILFIISPLFLIAAAIVGYFISRRAFAPVRLITKTAEQISGTQLNQRVPVGKAEDEISQLARTFNDMISRLDVTFESQKRFIADASHDFRTPLTIVRLELELLANRQDIDEYVKAPLDKCIRELKSLSNLAENLLLLARTDSHQLVLKKSEFRLDELIMDSMHSFNNILSAQNKVFILDLDEPVELYADKDLIKRAIINILDNAVKYSNPGNPIKIYNGIENSSTIIRISNTGPELSEELISKLFDRFQRGDDSRTTKGYGLGLPIIKAIIEEHGGKVIFSSVDGENTMIITLSITTAEDDKSAYNN